MAKYTSFSEKNITYERYGNNRFAIKIVDPLEGCLAVATVNLPNEPLEDDEVIIKNWSENEGILEDLIEMGIVSEPIRHVPTGFVSADVCKLLK